MGEVPIFTREQTIILDELRRNPEFVSRFYFTGGTALSGIYLRHRYSEDIDLFAEKRFNNQIIFSSMKKWGRKHHFTFQSRFAEVVYIFHLKFSKGTLLKVDFGFYPYKRLEKGTDHHGLTVDSLTDIAVNKLLTVSQRTDVKDFVDLYFLLRDISIYDLMEGVKIKFNMKIDPFLLASDLLKVEDFTFLPKMIVPLKLDNLKQFFREKAKELGMTQVE